MIQNKGGHIGITSSISGKFGFYLRSSYAASKHALHGYFESVGMEYESSGIYVTIACPGRVKTNISVNALAGDGKKHGDRDPGQEGGITPEECAVSYLKAIYRRKKEVLIGRKELIMVYLKRYFPGLFFKLSKKIKPL